MVVVLPEPLTPATRMTNGLRRHLQRLGDRRQHLLDLAASTAFTSSGVIALSKRPSRERRGDAAGELRPEIGADQFVLQRPRAWRRRACAWSPGRRWRAPSDDEVRLSPPLRRFHQLCRLLSFIVRPWRARDSRFGMTPEEMLARLLYRDGLMLVIDKPAGFAVHRGPKGGDEPGGLFRRAALRPAAHAGAGAPARQGHLRLPGARPPPQGAGAARQAVQAGQGRQDLLGGGRRPPRTPTKAASTFRSASSTRRAAGG